MTQTNAHGLRQATANDVVARLTGIDARRYRAVAETALGWGMSDAQLGITAALDAAIGQGRARVVQVRDGRRFVAATEKALHEDRTQMPCAPARQDDFCHIHNHFAARCIVCGEQVVWPDDIAAMVDGACGDCQD